MKSSGRILLTFLFFIISLPAQAQLLDPVSYEITGMPAEVKAGERFTVTIRAQMDEDWHLYSVHNDPDAGPYPTTFTPAMEHLLIAGEIIETEPRIVLDPNFNAKLGWHSKEADFQIPTVFDTLAQNTRRLAFDILYQVCDDRSCLPPKTKQVSADIMITGIADSPFIQSNNSKQGFFRTLYSFPSEFIKNLNGIEWVFWTGLFLMISGYIIFRRS